MLQPSAMRGLSVQSAEWLPALTSSSTELPFLPGVFASGSSHQGRHNDPLEIDSNLKHNWVIQSGVAFDSCLRNQVLTGFSTSLTGFLIKF